MDPNACKELIEASKIVKKARDGKKGPLAEEKATIDFAYASVVSIKMIKKDEILTRDNLWVKRPGTGEIPAEEYESILGKKATRDIQKDKHINRDDIYE